MEIARTLLPDALLLPAACGLPREKPMPTPTGFLDRSLAWEGRERRHVLYVPPGYDPGRPWPLVVFLHGLGERGDDGLLPTEVGLGPAIRRHRSRFPCLVLFPQCPADRRWTEALGVAEAALEETLADYPVDRKRIALTGISMGGFGAWAWAARRPDLFARLMPLCGGAEPAWAPRLAGLPTWAFHGARDPVIPPERSREMAAALEKAGGTVRCTEFPAATHNCWDQAYGMPETAAWLLAK